MAGIKIRIDRGTHTYCYNGNNQSALNWGLGVCLRKKIKKKNHIHPTLQYDFFPPPGTWHVLIWNVNRINGAKSWQSERRRRRGRQNVGLIFRIRSATGKGCFKGAAVAKWPTSRSNWLPPFRQIREIHDAADRVLRIILCCSWLMIPLN